MKNDYYRNKLVLITGGSSGIGFSLAKNLVEFEANVYILARREDQLKIPLAELEKLRQNPAQKIGYIQADVSNDPEITQKLTDFISTIGQPDVVINSAGVTRPGKFIEQTNDLARWMIEINYLGTLYVCRAVLPGMTARRSGHIINISSGAGFITGYGYAAYSGSKFAVRGFSDALRSELRYDNVRISIVFPADVDTPQLADENKYKPAITRYASEDNGGLMQPDAVAAIILKDAAKGKYTITPGFNASLFYFIKNFTVDFSFKIVDIIHDNAEKKAKAEEQKKLASITK